MKETDIQKPTKNSNKIRISASPSKKSQQTQEKHSKKVRCSCLDCKVVS